MDNKQDDNKKEKAINCKEEEAKLKNNMGINISMKNVDNAEYRKGSDDVDEHETDDEWIGMNDSSEKVIETDTCMTQIYTCKRASCEHSDRAKTKDIPPKRGSVDKAIEKYEPSDDKCEKETNDMSADVAKRTSMNDREESESSTTMSEVVTQTETCVIANYDRMSADKG